MQKTSEAPLPLFVVEVLPVYHGAEREERTTSKASHKRQLSSDEQSASKKLETPGPKSPKQESTTKRPVDLDSYQGEDAYAYIVSFEYSDRYLEPESSIVTVCQAVQDANMQLVSKPMITARAGGNRMIGTAA